MTRPWELERFLAPASQAAYTEEADARAVMAALGLPKFEWID